MPQITALQQTISAGGHTYPVFVGFLSAADLVQIAEAPAFTPSTTHEQIATNILTPPIKDWQRPLDDERVQNIADVYSNNSELMPNPVLLSENALLSTSGYNVSPLAPNQNLGVWIIDVPLPSKTHQPKPLWILDGQHRINGLAKSTQATNPIPLVLLLNNGGQFFAPSLLAKIFAQVTTEAQKLDPLHDAWLTYAFRLDIYSNDPARSHSMETVATLCKLPRISPSDPPNPFVNRIDFNARSGTIQSPQPGGFRFTCVELSDLLYKHYYNCATPVGAHLSPIDLARHIVLAHNALTQVVQAPQERTVFFANDSRYGQRIMQDAWFVGVLAHLANHCVPHSWVDLLRKLNFHTTDWNFSSWVQSLSGRESGRSRRLALRVFHQMFVDGKPPAGTTNLSNYLQGDSAELTLELSALSPAGRPQKKGRVVQSLPVAGTRSTQANQNTHVKLRPNASNISDIFVHDGTVRQGVPQEYAKKLKRGIMLDPNHITQPWAVEVTSYHYGGVVSTTTLKKIKFSHLSVRRQLVGVPPQGDLWHGC
ncbi:MAG: hypothetical protein JJU36_03850 [Phycisphaeraceae bacterium]|nr:hypothetical protein [Phycisphaeraceae bacterium]